MRSAKLGRPQLLQTVPLKCAERRGASRRPRCWMRTGPIGRTVFSSSHTKRITLCSLLGINVGRFRERLCTPAASLRIVEMTERGPLLEALGERANLHPSLHDWPGT